MVFPTFFNLKSEFCNKELLMEVKEESEKFGLKLSIQEN